MVYKAFMLFDIGRQIKLVRKSRKITQAELGKALGMSRNTIGQIEKGTVHDIGVRKIIRLLEYLGLEIRVRRAGMPPTLEELREEEVR
jgi:transcriptional regulator with XRE-family HTH domain